MATLLTLPSKPTVSYTSLSSFSSNADNLSLSLSSLSLHRSNRPQTLTIRMGGGPRTYPGGVSKWQWKRMQKKKATQLLKARLMRERQIYELRKRAELKAAVSELERPWEVVQQAAPNLFSVGADEQLKVLADRFQRPGGFDLWTHKDGPQLFQSPDALPTSRFLPEGVVHSIKPYGRVDLGSDDIGMSTEGGGLDSDSNSRVPSGQRNLDEKRSGRQRGRRIRDTEGGHVQRSSSSDSRVSRSGDRGNLDKKDSSGSRGDADDLSNSKSGNTRSVGSKELVNGAIKLPKWRRSASSTRQRRSSSDGGQIDPCRLEENRRRNEGLYDLSLQTDGSYSLGSSS